MRSRGSRWVSLLLYALLLLACGEGSGAGRTAAALMTGAVFGVAANDEGGVEVSTSGVQRARGAVAPGGWVQTGPLPTAREGHAAMAHQGRLYVIGGGDASGALSDVQMATLGLDGTCGAFASTSSFVGGRYDHASLIYNGRLYVIGGSDAGGPLADVQVAVINADGTIGSFSPTTSLPAGRSRHAVVAADGFMYVVGGSSGGAPLGDTLVAPIHADGTLGAWAQTASLGAAREQHAAVAANGWLYVVGGFDGASPRGEVFVARPGPDGFVPLWAPVTPMPKRRRHAALFHQGQLWVLGGVDEGRLGDVQVAAVRTDGTLDDWVSAGTFGPPREHHAAAAHRGFLYVIGGYDDGPLASVRVAALERDSILSSAWTPLSALTTGVFQHAGVVHDDYVYVIGGESNAGTTDAVQLAAVLPDGSLGPWSATTALPAGRFAHAVTAFNGWLYVLGGEQGGAIRSSVLRAGVGPSGALGSWSATTSLTVARREHEAVIHNGFVYVLGGETGSEPLASVEYAPVQPDGALGAWRSTTPFSVARSCFVAFAHNGFMYVVGGYVNARCAVSGADTASVEYAPIDSSDGALGPWARTTPMLEGLDSMGNAVNHGQLYLAGGFDEDVGRQVSTVTVAPLLADGTLGPWRKLTPLESALDWTLLLSRGRDLYRIGGTPNGFSGSSTVSRARIVDGASGSVDWRSGPALPGARSRLASVVHEGFLYALGGANPSPHDEVYRAALASNGDLSPWSIAGTLPSGRERHAAVSCRGHLYLVGGFDGSARRADVHRAVFTAEGTLSGWVAARPLPTERDGHAATCDGAFLYVVAGQTGTGTTADVHVAEVGADGALSVWSAAGALPAGRSGHAALVYAGQLFVVGGRDDGGPSEGVLVAAIPSGGLLGPWRELGGMGIAREELGAVARAGYLIAVGGTNGSMLGGVEVAELLEGGRLGTWRSDGWPVGRRRGHAVASWGGRIYVLGGTSESGQQLDDVQVGSLKGSARRGRYTELLDLGQLGTLDSITVGGAAPRSGTVSLTYRTAATSSVLGPPRELGSIELGGTRPLGAPNVSHVWLRVELDDASADVLGSTAVTTLSQVAIEFTPGATSLPDAGEGADGGSGGGGEDGPGLRELGVGCGCMAPQGSRGASWQAWLLLLSVLNARRRKWRPASAELCDCSQGCRVTASRPRSLRSRSSSSSEGLPVAKRRAASARSLITWFGS